MIKLKRVARALIFVATGSDGVPATKPADAMLVGTGTRMVPTVYDELRTKKRFRLLAMAAAVGLPTVVASLYYGVFASSRYVSQTDMVLSEQSGGPGAISSGAGGAGKSSLLSLVGMGGGEGGGESNESAIVTNFLQSPEVVEKADAAIGLRHMWTAPSIDHLSRLRKNASLEDFHKYYKKHVAVVADPMEPVIQVQVEAFTPGDAQLISKTLVKLAQDKLNSAFEGMREDALLFARSEVSRAEQQLATANNKLRDFRNAHNELDPQVSAQGVGSVSMALYAQLASAEAELRTTLSYARDASPAVKSLKVRIDALKRQISENQGMLAGGGGDQKGGDQKGGDQKGGDQKGKVYADQLATYENLVLEQKFSQEAYTSAMSFLSTSRTALAHQHTYLIDFLPPTLPEEATEPRGARNVLVVFLASALLWLTGSLVMSALREHARR